MILLIQIIILTVKSSSIVIIGSCAVLCLYLLPLEPSGFLNLVFIHFDVGRYGDSEATNHEVGRHGPGLTGDVLNRTNLHTALLLHLPPHRVLHRLPCGDTKGEKRSLSSLSIFSSQCREMLVTWLHKSSQTREHASWKDLLPSQ